MSALNVGTGFSRRFARVSGIGYGIATQILFVVTVWFLFWFLRDGSLTDASENWILRDCGLALLFAVSHSTMLVPRTRGYLRRWIPSAFYDATFCLVTCVTLLVLFFGWRSSATALWQATGAAEIVIRSGFYVSWIALFYSLSLTGLGHQTGWTPFFHWLGGNKPPQREFCPRGAYRWVRHPVYLSFLGLIWFTPRMTLDHAVLTAIWTAYIFYGSVLKDRRLEHFLGQRYRDYESMVPGYPFVTHGRLARRAARPIGVKADRSHDADLRTTARISDSAA